MHVCEFMGIHVGMHVHVCTHTHGCQRSMSGIFISHSPPFYLFFFLRKDLLLNWGFPISARQAGQQAPLTLLSLRSQHCGYRGVHPCPAFIWVLDTNSYSLPAQQEFCQLSHLSNFKNILTSFSNASISHM